MPSPTPDMTNDLTIYLYDSDECHADLLPLSFTRPVADFRVGIDTIRSKWEQLLPASYRYLPVEYLREKFGTPPEDDATVTFVTGALVPDPDLAAAVAALAPGEALLQTDALLAFRGTWPDLQARNWSASQYDGTVQLVKYTFDIFRINRSQITPDFFRLTAGRRSEPLDPSNTVVGPYTDGEGRPLIFLEEGASVFGAVLNTTKGPIYIGRNAEVMETACLRGPIALGDNSKVKMGAKIYSHCTFGPYCKVSGEIECSVFFGYSNKAHDGYLGDAVIGEWCNIGAGVNASNLKNDYSLIRVWNYRTHRFMRTDLQFCGPIIGDHTKIGVNCMLNTATVLGVGVNIHGAGFPRVFVPSFSEGSPAAGFTNVPMKKFHEIAERVMSRRGLHLTDSDRRIYDKVHEVAMTFKG